MKHIAIQDLPRALESIWNHMNSQQHQIPLDDLEHWASEVKDEVISGASQIFACGDHFVLVEHGVYPMRNTPVVLVHNPQCEHCRRAGETVAEIRGERFMGTVEYSGNQLTITTEELK